MRRLYQPPEVSMLVYATCAVVLAGYSMLGYRMHPGAAVSMGGFGVFAGAAMVLLPRDCTWADVRSWLARPERNH